MKRLMGSLDILIAVIFAIIAMAALFGLPGAFQRRAAESEDFYILLFLFVLMTASGIASALIGWALIRENNAPGRARRRTLHLSGWFAVGMLLVSIVGFLPSEYDPTAKELRLFLLPAIVFGASFLLLRKSGGQKAVS